jgi:hypothetical protein
LTVGCYEDLKEELEGGFQEPVYEAEDRGISLLLGSPLPEPPCLGLFDASLFLQA